MSFWNSSGGMPASEPLASLRNLEPPRSAGVVARKKVYEVPSTLNNSFEPKGLKDMNV